MQALFVKDFVTEPDFDVTTIYDGTVIPDNVVATLSGTVVSGKLSKTEF